MDIEQIPIREKKSDLVEQLALPKQDDPLKIKVGTWGGEIFVLFNRPMSQISFTKKDAREFARLLVKESLK